MTTVIQIRGTSGSGKSTAVQEIITANLVMTPKYVTGRKRPLYYDGLSLKGTIAVLGHYEIPCGGCDTIGSVPQVFDVLDKLSPYQFVLCEGLLLSEDVKWVLAFREKGFDFKIVFLTTTEAQCLDRVRRRQQDKGREPADPERVRRKLTRRIETIERARLRLVDAGVSCFRMPQSQAVSTILRWLKE